VKKFLMTFCFLSFSLASIASEINKTFQLNVGAVRPDLTHEVTLCLSGGEEVPQCDVLGHFTSKEIKSGALKQKLKKYGSVGAITGTAVVAGAGAITGGFLIIGPLYGSSALAVYATYGTIGVAGAGIGGKAAGSFEALKPSTYSKREKLLNNVIDLMQSQGGQVQLNEEEVASLMKSLPKKK
jgi:hypothetical protein